MFINLWNKQYISELLEVIESPAEIENLNRHSDEGTDSELTRYNAMEA